MTEACLYHSRNFPSTNDNVLSRVINTATVSTHVLITDIVMLFSGEDLAGINRISLSTCSTFGGRVSVNIVVLCLTSNSSGLFYVALSRWFVSALMRPTFSRKKCRKPVDSLMQSSRERAMRDSIRCSTWQIAAHRPRGSVDAASILLL